MIVPTNVDEDVEAAAEIDDVIVVVDAIAGVAVLEEGTDAAATAVGGVDAAVDADVAAAEVEEEGCDCDRWHSADRSTAVEVLVGRSDTRSGECLVDEDPPLDLGVPRTTDHFSAIRDET